MIQRSWGIELWDQFDNVTKYSDRTIQFYEKYESFLKDRCTIEDEYARTLKKLTKTYTPKSKEQEDFYNKYTFTTAFTATLKELNDLASQHELIAENIRERSIKQIQQTIRECREQRKKSLDEFQKLKRHLEKQYDLLMKSLRKYEECYDSARRAKDNFEKANEDLDLSRAQLERARELMNSKAKIADDAHQSYLAQVTIYNENQHLYYEQQLPSLLSDLQQYDSQHSDQTKQVYRQFIQAHQEVLPRIQTCLNEMSKQTEQINAMVDENRVIDEYKSGYGIPEDYQPVDLNGNERRTHWQSNDEQVVYDEVIRSNTLKSIRSDSSSNAHVNSNGGQTSDVNPRKRTSKTSTIKKIFGSSNQRKSILPSSTNASPLISVNAPYPNLPPAQRMKKFQEHIQNYRNEYDRQQKAKEGLVKMKVVFQENPKFGDEHDVSQQIATIDEHLEQLMSEIRQYESYIADIERVQNPTYSDTDSPLRTRSSHGSNQSISPDPYGVVAAKRSSPEQQLTTTTTTKEMTSDGNDEQLVYNHSLASSTNEYHCLPSISSLTIDQTDRTTADETNGSFEEEELDHEPSTYRDNTRKAFALYPFTGRGSDGCEYINAASIDANECVTVLEEDQGDGWTRIEKFDGTTGFVPSSYLRFEPVALYQTNRF